MPATTLLHDCSALIDAVRAADGEAPEVLANILAGAALLRTHSTVVDPAHTVVKAAVDGTLTAERLGELVTEAAHTQNVNNYLGELRQRSERMFVQEFHKALAAGACDELLDTLRPTWDEHAAAVAEARGEISPESSAEHILMSGSPRLVQCWQQLPTHLAALDRIAAVARQFGPRLGNFPMIEEYANADGYLLEDAAIWCADGGLETDSAAFRRPSPQPRQHPLFNVPLKLHTLSSARTRYKGWAGQQWESRQAGSAGPSGWMDEHGAYHKFPRPANPFAEAAQ